MGGKITVTAANHGIKGKDSITIAGASIDVTAGADGMQSDNEEDVSKGYVSISSGTIDITAGDDGIQAERNITINGGEITISAGTTTSKTGIAKGIKAGSDITITDGNINLDSADDAINSAGTLEISGGNLILSSGDDALHADSEIKILGGSILVPECYWGIESSSITINDGYIQIVSRDDGINGVSAGQSSVQPGPGGSFSQGGNRLEINGGYIAVDALGDGLDINGPITMTGGTVLINGPVSDGNGALDYENYFTVCDGLLIAAGSSGMAEAPSTSSSQYSVMVYFDSAQQANSIVHIETEDGKEIMTFSPTKTYESVVLSSPELEMGETYLVYSGGSSTGTINDSLYSGGTYTPGTQIYSFTISSTVTTVGSSGSGGPGGGVGGFPGGRPP